METVTYKVVTKPKLGELEWHKKTDINQYKKQTTTPFGAIVVTFTIKLLFRHYLDMPLRLINNK